MRRLIVNADDFGLTSGVNRAIIEAHTRGIVTSATLMANMPAFDEAVLSAKAHPTLGVGLHFNITQGRPVAAPEQVRSLLNEDGEFLGTSAALLRRLLGSAVDSYEIIREFRAQAEKVLDAGLRLTHVDSHKHAHALPPVFAALNSALGRYSIHAVRLPREHVRWLCAFRSPKLFKQSLTAVGLRLFCSAYPRLMKETGAQTTEAFFGVAQTGFWTKDWLKDLLSSLPLGTSELMCHPGYDDDVLGQARTRLRASREIELQLLTDPEIAAHLRAQAIQLIHYGQL
jgi:hopanoid biosynthesis associated protein HpnK